MADLFFRHFEDEDGMTDEDSVMLARTPSQKKKKKRSHIRFGVTILDTGNERKERERASQDRASL